MRTAATSPEDGSYHAYLVGRLERSLHLAEAAGSDTERATHLRACRYYCDLLGHRHLK